MTHSYGHNPQMTAGDTGTVLLVEDTPDIRDLLHLVLTEAGYRVTAVATGTEALVALAEIAYALVVTDYHLPDMTGAAVAQATQQCVPPPTLLLMSGHPEIALVAKTIGADGWFRKGDPLPTLLTQIARLLEARP